MREEIKKARLKKKVLRQYPNAKPVQSTDGIQIHAGDIFIAKEYYMPSTRCIDTAVEYAANSCKTTQNFNRTHPMKMGLGAIEERINRINRRKHRGRKNAK